jgi:glycosyltransferase involved in cell wall biosynthesis
MKKHFRVSAIVSTYNSEKFIRGCLQDLIEQTLYQKGELQIIVIDSASPQDEKMIVEQFQSQYPNIIYHRTVTRETIYAAWNRAIEIAQGSYITNANTDDRRRYDALELMANYLDNHSDISLVYADQFITNIANETFANTQAEQRLNWPDYSYRELKQRCCVGSQPMWRKSLHETFGNFRSDFHCAGDYEFWLRIGSQGEKMALIPEILGLYYLNPQGIEYGTPGRASEESKLVRKLYTNNQTSGSRFKSRLVPLVSLIVGIILLIFSILFKVREPWLSVSGVLLSLTLILGIVGYLRWINARILRLTRVILAGAGLAFLILALYSATR